MKNIYNINNYFIFKNDKKLLSLFYFTLFESKDLTYISFFMFCNSSIII